MRLQHPLAPHPLGEMTFNPAARPGDPDWRVMYLGAGDAQSGEQRDSRRLNPQRLDTLVGKILRIVPDLREHTKTSAVSENGRYRIPNDNPFVDDGRRTQGDLGLRPAQPAPAGWHVDPARPAACHAAGVQHRPRLLGDGRRHPQGRELRVSAARGHATACHPTNGTGPIPDDDTIPIQISDTVARGTVRPTYPVLQYSHSRETGGDAIANGFVYRGKLIPALTRQARFRRHHHRADVVREHCRRARGRRRRGEDRRPDSRDRHHPASSWSKRRTARAAGKRRRCPAWPRLPDPAASTSGLPRTTMASSTS